MKEAIIRLLSWFWDIPIEKTSSPQNDYLEVVWTNGRKMLNTKEANFSFGNGYKVFETAMKPIADKIQVSKDILILGLCCNDIFITSIKDSTFSFANKELAKQIEIRKTIFLMIVPFEIFYLLYIHAFFEALQIIQALKTVLGMLTLPYHQKLLYQENF